jgi:hypothetical protein
MGRTTPTVRQILESLSVRVTHSSLIDEDEKRIADIILKMGRKHSDAILESGIDPEFGLIFFALVEILRKNLMDGEDGRR